MSSTQSRSYGLRVGLAAATATAISFTLGVQDIGWIVGATLFVMRPSEEVQQLGSVWRAVSVFAGSLTASWLLTLNLQPLMIAALTAGARQSLVYHTGFHNLSSFLGPAIWSGNDR